MSDIIYNPPASSGGTTINPTNNYIPVRSNATTFIDSCFTIIASNTLQSVFAGTSKGLELDSFQKLYRLGDYALSTNGTMLVVDENNETISTKNINEPKGLFFDYNNAIYKFGDYNGYNNHTSLIINDNGANIYTRDNSAVNGINFDFVNKNYYFGALSNGTYLSTDGNNSYAQININSNPYLYLDALNDIFYFGDSVTGFQFYMNKAGNNADIRLNNTPYLTIDGASNITYLGLQGDTAVFFTDFSNGFCSMGDVFGNGNSTNIMVDDFNSKIITQYQGSVKGILLDYGSDNYKFGDYKGVSNATALFINDSIKQIRLRASSGEISFSTDLLLFDGSLTTPSASGNSGQHLKVNINGTNYVIQLLNP
jgi:hypothetical protein